MDSDTHSGGGSLATLGLSFGSFEREDGWCVEVEAFVSDTASWPAVSLLIENADNVSVLCYRRS